MCAIEGQKSERPILSKEGLIREGILELGLGRLIRIHIPKMAVGECSRQPKCHKDFKNSENDNGFDAASAQEAGRQRSRAHAEIKKGFSWSQSEISKEVWTPLFRQQCTYIFAFIRIHIVLVKTSIENINGKGCREVTVIN